jgi:hypothetical protein
MLRHSASVGLQEHRLLFLTEEKPTENQAKERTQLSPKDRAEKLEKQVSDILEQIKKARSRSEAEKKKDEVDWWDERIEKLEKLVKQVKTSTEDPAKNLKEEVWKSIEVFIAKEEAKFKIPNNEQATQKIPEKTTPPRAAKPVRSLKEELEAQAKKLNQEQETTAKPSTNTQKVEPTVDQPSFTAKKEPPKNGPETQKKKMVLNDIIGLKLNFFQDNTTLAYTIKLNVDQPVELEKALTIFKKHQNGCEIIYNEETKTLKFYLLFTDNNRWEEIATLKLDNWERELIEALKKKAIEKKLVKTDEKVQEKKEREPGTLNLQRIVNKARIEIYDNSVNSGFGISGLHTPNREVQKQMETNLVELRRQGFSIINFIFDMQGTKVIGVKVGIAKGEPAGGQADENFTDEQLKKMWEHFTVIEGEDWLEKMGAFFEKAANDKKK